MAAELKASGVNSAIAALREVAGPEVFARILATLPAAARAMVDKPPMPMTWVEAARYAEVLQAAARELDEPRMMEAARVALRNDLKGVYKVFIRVLSPFFVINRGAQLWETYARNNGRVRTVALERGAEVHYEGIAVELSFPMYWVWQRGALQAIGEASGLKHVKVETVSGGGHLGRCVMRASW